MPTHGVACPLNGSSRSPAVDPEAAHGLAHPEVTEHRMRRPLLGHRLAVLGDGDVMAASIGVVSCRMMTALGTWAFKVSTCSGENDAMKSISPA